mgnify:CR=1 FL=1
MHRAQAGCFFCVLLTPNYWKIGAAVLYFIFQKTFTQ